MPGDVFRHLETAALERKPAEFMRILEQALGISAEHAHRIVKDQGGEPLLVAAKALGIATTWRSEASNPSSRRDRTVRRQSNTIGKPTSGWSSSLG